MVHQTLLKLIFAAGTALGLALSSAQAGQVVVTFDSSPTGFTNSVGGITFTGGIGGAGINIQPYYLDPNTYPNEPTNFYNPSNKGAALNNATNSCCANTPTVTATFAQDVQNVSMQFSDTEIGSYLGYMAAYDASGALLGNTGFVVTPNNAYPGWSTLSLNYTGIRSIQFYTDWDGALVDNLSYNVPAPGALALVGFGLLGLAARRRKAAR